ncbi:hypothetical protein San01_58260 [Streptomyces angustmyceticus]|uniref:Nudix hydrolase domain-containing protein n=1 Tax=Streptomyces angustmyceticus TaxID=285578 RepID=A0A5J4LSM4_9ACTN|nr:hypothetical protein San01_58260 [Streptomyces angustmyceticus]
MPTRQRPATRPPPWSPTPKQGRGIHDRTDHTDRRSPDRPTAAGERFDSDSQRSGRIPAAPAGRHPGTWEPGSWSLLGGGREPGDRSLEDTARRELWEEAGLRGVCPDCGSQLCALDDGAGGIAITLSALDDASGLVPVDQSFRDDAVAWLPQVPDTRRSHRI